MRIKEKNRLRDYVFTGIALGMCVATKYPGIIAVIPPFLLCAEKGLIKTKRLFPFLLLIGTSIITFSVITPHFWFSLPKVIHDFLYEARTYHLGNSGLSPLGNIIFYLKTISNQTIGVLISFSALLGIIVYAKNEPKKTIIFLSFPFVFFITLSLHSLHWLRWMIPVLPFIAMASAYGLSSFLQKIQPKSHFLQYTISILSIIFMFYPTVLRGMRTTISYLHKETRETAYDWITNSLPAQSTIAQERYTPSLQTLPFTTIFKFSLGENSLKYYQEQKVNYLILNNDNNLKVIQDSDSQPFIVKNYKEITTQANLLKTFPSSNNDRAYLKIEQGDFHLFTQNPFDIKAVRGPALSIYAVPQ